MHAAASSKVRRHRCFGADLAQWYKSTSARLAVGPDFNRQVLGNSALLRTTGQTLCGPADSSQRRLRFGLTRMQGTQHKQQRQLVMPPCHKKSVESYHELMVNSRVRSPSGPELPRPPTAKRGRLGDATLPTPPTQRNAGRFGPFGVIIRRIGLSE